MSGATTPAWNGISASTIGTRGSSGWSRDLNRLYRQEPALHELDHDWTGFQWIDFHDAANSVIAFLRKAKNQNNQILCLCNFTPVPRYDYQVGVPQRRLLSRILQHRCFDLRREQRGKFGRPSDTSAVPSHGMPHSLGSHTSPLSVLFLKRI